MKEVAESIWIDPIMIAIYITGAGLLCFVIWLAKMCYIAENEADKVEEKGFPSRVEKTQKYDNIIAIKLLNSKDVSFALHDVGERSGIVEPWKLFYKWYYCRPQSPSYLMQGKGYDTMILRSEIVGFSVAILPRPAKEVYL